MNVLEIVDRLQAMPHPSMETHKLLAELRRLVTDSATPAARAPDRCVSCEGSWNPCRTPGKECKHYLRWLANHPSRLRILIDALENEAIIYGGCDSGYEPQQRVKLKSARDAVDKAIEGNDRG